MARGERQLRVLPACSDRCARITANKAYVIWLQLVHDGATC